MLEVIRLRRSVRKYLKKDVEDEKLNEILEAAMFAPTARGLRPWASRVLSSASIGHPPPVR